MPKGVLIKKDIEYITKKLYKMSVPENLPYILFVNPKSKQFKASVKEGKIRKIGKDTYTIV